MNTAIQTRQNQTRALVESAVMIALATALSIPALISLPYGGSVTVASLLPIVIISYRNGIRWGLGSGLVFGVIQQLLGLKNLTYVTGWQSADFSGSQSAIRPPRSSAALFSVVCCAIFAT